MRDIFYDKRVAITVSILLFFILCAVFAPFLTSFDIDASDIVERLCKPSYEHWLGCDLNGADVWTALLYGARVSLYVGAVAVVCSMGVGVSLGLIAGFFGGWIESIIMRAVDLVMAFPGILLALALASVLGPNVHNVILAITLTGWTSSARVVRAMVLSLKEREYVLACRALGGSNFRIITRHIFPQLTSILFIQVTFSLSGAILVESTLSFLGLGVNSNTPTWGALINQGRTVLQDAPHLSLAPGIALFIFILCLNILGDALRDYFDFQS